MIDTARIIAAKYPAFAKRHSLIRSPALTLLRRSVHENEINAFLDEHAGLRGFDFIDRVQALLAQVMARRSICSMPFPVPA